MEIIRIIHAIQALLPNAKCSVKGDDCTNIEWFDERDQPTDKQITDKLAELRAEYAAQEYARNRQTEYPTIEECVHAILDNDNNELDTLQAKRAEIKLKYPKGG